MPLENQLQALGRPLEGYIIMGGPHTAGADDVVVPRGKLAKGFGNDVYIVPNDPDFRGTIADCAERLNHDREVRFLNISGQDFIAHDDDCNHDALFIVMRVRRRQAQARERSETLAAGMDHEYDCRVMEETLQFAEAAIRNGDFDEAIRALTDVLEDEPDDPRALSDIGVCFTETGENDKAEKALSFCLKLDPQNVEALEALGCAYLRENRHREAEQHLDEAYALAPKNASVLRNLSVLYSQTDRHEESFATLEQSYALNPRDYLTLYALSFAYLNEERPEDARRVLNELLDLDVPANIRDLAERRREEIDAGG